MPSNINYVLKKYDTDPNLRPGDKLIRKVSGTLVAGELEVDLGDQFLEGAELEYVILSKVTVTDGKFTAANTDPTDTGKVDVLVFFDIEDHVGQTTRS